MVEETLLYQELTKITEDYFGPVAPRFINRIIDSHLHKQPSELTKKDLPELLTWVRIAVNMITDEEKVIVEFTGRIEKLVV